MYCAPAWSGWCSAADLARLGSFLRLCKRQNYSDNDLPSITRLFGKADDTLFRSILTNKQHVLQSFLPERPNISYNLRDRSHNRNLLAKTASLSDRDFIIRMFI